MTKLEYMIRIADSAIYNLERIVIESEYDDAHVREIARQVSDRAASYHRDGWLDADYANLKRLTYASAIFKMTGK